ncbi:MAG: hypothetical protein LBQ66_13510, partial [Planctomycetaceae bacterium]|nr:hypothetical protein [Planctomycetaceae bacterium]
GIFGNEIKQVQTIAGFNKPIEQNFVTDINGLKTEKSFSVDGKIDHTNKYEFDSLNRATNISQTIENNTIKSLQINYDDFGQLAKQSRFDADKPIIETENKYDEAGRLINISHAGNQKIYADYDITWDNGNRITDFDFTYLNGPAKKNQSNYNYDKTSQLTSATYNFMQDERYDFDKNGNRIKAEIQGQKQQYKTAEYNRLISDNESEYKYDLEGNRIAKISKDGSTIKYYWDNRNRLTKLDTPNGSIEYIYDHQNRLVLRKQGETTTTFIHDGWQIVLQFDNDKLTHRYLWGTKQDELICDNDNWTLCDHLNTIRDIVKSDGTVTDHLEYNSFGKIISATKNDSSLQFAYTGKLTDKVSELQWNINRWYDANVGRWVSEDPIGFEGGDFNLSKYVANSPLFMKDFLGLKTYAEACPNAYNYLKGLLDVGQNCEVQFANVMNELEGHEAIVKMFLKALNEQNDANANASLLQMMFGNIGSVEVVTALSIEAVVSPTISGLETVAHRRGANGRYTKLSPTDRVNLQALAKTAVVAAIAGWAISTLNNAFMVYATAQLTEATSEYLTSLQGRLNERRNKKQQVENAMDKLVLLQDYMLDNELKSESCDSVMTTLRRIEPFRQSFNNVNNSNQRLVNLSRQAVNKLRKTMTR